MTVLSGWPLLWPRVLRFRPPNPNSLRFLGQPIATSTTAPATVLELKTLNCDSRDVGWGLHDWPANHNSADC
ncbi:hypothetical protein AMR42_06820 [Limnothrix sp. PR1529]|nr:hypothetical protein BCR12_03500 [Limnothrix sp. P13C2]PIB14280.1 hypothetical protein AMR42_06820 [Limnothrix sp. PR1529]